MTTTHATTTPDQALRAAERTGDVAQLAVERARIGLCAAHGQPAMLDGCETCAAERIARREAALAAAEAWGLTPRAERLASRGWQRAGHPGYRSAGDAAQLRYDLLSSGWVVLGNLRSLPGDLYVCAATGAHFRGFAGHACKTWVGVWVLRAEAS